MYPNLTAKVEVEVDKTVTVGFIRDVHYPIWLANVVPVKKKTRKSESALILGTLKNPVPRMIF